MIITRRVKRGFKGFLGKAIQQSGYVTKRTEVQLVKKYTKTVDVRLPDGRVIKRKFKDVVEW